MQTAVVAVADVAAAAARTQPWLHCTPVFSSASLDAMAGLQLFFKAENMQKTGSFKARGATNAVFSLIEEEGRDAISGIVTHSSGNHGQATAYAAKCAGLPCCVVVPRDTPQGKCDAIRGYGAELLLCEPSPTARKETAAEVESSRGYRLVHPYDEPRVLAGQGTIAWELHQQVPDLDAILVPISGGGMTAGIAVATAGIRPQCKVYAVEPAGKELGPCLKAKQRLWPDPPAFLNTIADSIRTQQTGHVTFPLLCEHVQADVLTVTDADMVEGMRLAHERLKLVVEAASGAAVYAGVHLAKARGLRKVGVVLCGGNTWWLPPALKQ